MKFKELDNPVEVFNDLVYQCKGKHWIKKAYILAWTSYKNNNWKYDGATFVREHNNNYWEVAAFIHDWLNHEGYVGKEVDLYFIKIMIALNYSANLIFERAKWMQWTFLNVFWHKIKRNYKGSKLPNYL